MTSRRRSTPTPQMHGRYLVRNRALHVALRSVDTALRLWPQQAPPSIPHAPQRVLIAIGGQLGDAVVASTTIHAVRALLPHAEIGVLAPSGARLVLERHPDVARIHIVDHWLSRSSESLARRMQRYRRDRRRAAAEIRAANYDVAFDIYPFYPNSARVLYAARVPVRVGFTSAGFGALYTHRVDYAVHDRHMIELQVELIANHLGVSRDVLASIALAPVQRVAPSRGYVVAHLAGGTAEREWPDAHWRELLTGLVVAGHSVRCTGLAGREAALAERITRGLPGCENLCGTLDWDGFVDAIRGAEMVVCIDSAASHVAAAAGVPVVALTAGIGRVVNFRPYSPRGVALTHPVPCAPCFRRDGCEEMTCLGEITVADARAAIAQACAAAPARG